MTGQSGLYDKITICGETFRRFHSSEELQVLQDGVWTSIPYVGNRAILKIIENMMAAVQDEREACAKIAETAAVSTEDVDLAVDDARHAIAAAIRARGENTD